MTAFSSGLSASVRAIAASTSSAGLASPERTSSACAVASSDASSSVTGNRLSSEELLEPDREAVRQPPHPAHRQQHARHEGARGRSSRGGSSASGPRRRRSPPGGRPGPEGGPSGSARGRCPRPRAISSAVRFAVPEGASSLRSWWSSTISHSGMCGAAWRRGLHHQHRADREVGRDEAVGARRPALDRRAQLVEVEAGGPDDGVDAGLDAGARRWRAPLGRREVDHHVGAVEHVGERRVERRIGAAGQLQVVGALDGLADRLAPSARRRRETTTRITRSCGDQRLADRRERAAEELLVGADAAAERPLGA